MSNTITDSSLQDGVKQQQDSSVTNNNGNGLLTPGYSLSENMRNESIDDLSLLMNKRNNQAATNDVKPKKGNQITQFDVNIEPVSYFSFTKTQETKAAENNLQQEIEDQLINAYAKKASKVESKPFELSDVVPFLVEGVEAIVKDDFTECFMPKPPEDWNWNIVLFPTWAMGVIVRYCILLPVRMLFFTLGTLLFLSVLGVFMLLPESDKKKRAFRKVIQFYAAIWLISLNGVIKVHGVIPKRRKNQIYVANHTSLIDFIILNELVGFATVGQHHTGLVGFIQDKIIAPLGNIWFERFEANDRATVAKRMAEHISDVNNPPLLIFPEGVCVNNEYCVMFKKGVFELPDVEICPIAMKYNKLFSDPYWSSRSESFMSHIIRIMKSWCLMCDVYFLEPQKIRPDENAVQFATRVKTMIAKKAKLIDVPWDGYLKYYKPSKRFTEQKQKLFAQNLLKKWGEQREQQKDEEEEKKQQQQQQQKISSASEKGNGRAPAPAPAQLFERKPLSRINQHRNSDPAITMRSPSLLADGGDGQNGELSPATAVAKMEQSSPTATHDDGQQQQDETNEDAKKMQ
eukprot:GEZU01002576.1.p1 GENE.GEZU01002576.1~~GEZU01002576.1.p1  ORF type:complete len:573 (-),score=204.78 GEZU01002576.1:29-1747(-)